MRVALIGNMNNNNFALMRYLRDLGMDAHLLMYSDEAEHFHPKCDTWELEKWTQYISQLPFSNGSKDTLFLKKRDIEKVINGFEFYIGNGISPVIFKN